MSSPEQPSPEKPALDWETIERDFRAGSRAVTSIAGEHGITEGAIRKRAKRDGWVRLLKDKASTEPKAPKVRTAAARPVLDPRHQRFVDEYLIDLNGTQAYTRAYGCSEKAGRTNAARLLTNAGIQDAIAAGRAKTAAKLGLTRERVLAEYAKLAFFDMRQAYHDSGALKLPHEMDEDAAAAIAAYETVEMSGGDREAPPLLVRKIKWADKRAALDSIMKAQDWNKSDVGTAENPLVVRDISDAERAVRMSRVLHGNPALVATLAQMLAGKAGA